jgi:DNA-binding beta-propeller fold protein YncE
MKKIILTILLISATIMIAGAQAQIPKLSLDEFITEYLPDYRIEKQIQLDGTARDFAVAKDTGDIVVVTQLDDSFRVYFFDSIGDLIWDKEFDTIGHTLTCRISDDGSYIVVTNYLSITKNIVLDNLGNILFEKQLNDIELVPTPDGNYFYEKVGGMSDREKGLFIYDLSGNEIKISGFDFSDKKNIRIKFINSSRIMSYMQNKIILLHFDNGFFKKIWEHELQRYHPFDDYFYSKVKSNINCIAVISHTPEGLSYIFDWDGKIVYQDNFYQSFDFINEEEIIFGRRFKKNTLLRKLNTITSDYEDYDYPFNINYFNNIYEVNNYLLFHFDYHNNIKGSTIIITDKTNYIPQHIFNANIKLYRNRLLFYETVDQFSILYILGGNHEN